MSVGKNLPIKLTQYNAPHIVTTTMLLYSPDPLSESGEVIPVSCSCICVIISPHQISWAKIGGRPFALSMLLFLPLEIQDSRLKTGKHTGCDDTSRLGTIFSFWPRGETRFQSFRSFSELKFCS